MFKFIKGIFKKETSVVGSVGVDVNVKQIPYEGEVYEFIASPNLDQNNGDFIYFVGQVIGRNISGSIEIATEKGLLTLSSENEKGLLPVRLATLDERTGVKKTLEAINNNHVVSFLTHNCI